MQGTHQDIAYNVFVIDCHEYRPDGHGNGRLEKMSAQCVQMFYKGHFCCLFTGASISPE
jgi:hypothetical protein